MTTPANGSPAPRRPLAPVLSLADLQRRCAEDERYRHLAVGAAQNLGQPVGRGPDAWKGALQCLYDWAAFLEGACGCGDGERATVEGINFAIDLVGKEQG